MPEHFPFRKPSGKKTNRSQGPCMALTDGFIRKQNLPPGRQREPEGFSSGPLPTCSRETTSNYKALSCKSASDAGCGEAQRGCRCSQLLASPSARGDARFRPAIRIITLQPGAVKITWAGLHASCILMTPVQLQAENTRWLPLLQFLPRFYKVFLYLEACFVDVCTLQLYWTSSSLRFSGNIPPMAYN